MDKLVLPASATVPKPNEAGALILTSGLTCWFGIPNFYKGKGVLTELNFVNARGVWVCVGMNRMRLLHLLLRHLGYECLCEEAAELVDFASGAVVVLSARAGDLTNEDWDAICAMAWQSSTTQAHEDARLEKTALELTGEHRKRIEIATTLPQRA